MVIFNNIILILEKYWGLFLQGIGVTLMLSAIADASEQIPHRTLPSVGLYRHHLC